MSRQRVATPRDARGAWAKSVRVPRELSANPHIVFLALVEQAGLMVPTVELQFAKDAGRRWRFDYSWNLAPMLGRPNRIRVALEVEGGIWSKGGGRHNRGKGMLADMEKYNEAAIRGWKVLRVTPQQLATPETIALIQRALQP